MKIMKTSNENHINTFDLWFQNMFDPWFQNISHPCFQNTFNQWLGTSKLIHVSPDNLKIDINP